MGSGVLLVSLTQSIILGFSIIVDSVSMAISLNPRPHHFNHQIEASPSMTVSHLSEHWKVLQIEGHLWGLFSVLCASPCISGHNRHLASWSPEVSFGHVAVLFAGLGGKGPVLNSPVSSIATSQVLGRTSLPHRETIPAAKHTHPPQWSSRGTWKQSI